MSARETLLAKISDRLSAAPLRQDRATLKARMESHQVNLMPARADKPEAERVALFLQKCEELAISVEHLAAPADVPAAAGAWLKSHNLPPRLRLSPDPAVSGLDWSGQPLLEIAHGAAQITDQASLTPVAAAIAETGTLVFTSSADTPATLNFVPDNHIVMLKRSQILRGMEDAFAQIRARFGEGNMPRTVNLVSGPSRTGDVEQKIVMGAHGPRRLHILLVDDVE